MKASEVTYCIDTSCLIAAWEERYPPENFPRFWVLLEECIEAGRLVAPIAVLDETSRKSHELHAWLKERSTLFVDFEEEIQLGAKEVLRAYPRLVMAKKERTSADPFVIATARVRGLMVVTEEKPTGNLNKPHIPDICREYRMECINLLQLIRAEAWVIG